MAETKLRVWERVEPDSGTLTYDSTEICDVEMTLREKKQRDVCSNRPGMGALLALLAPYVPSPLRWVVRYSIISGAHR